MMPMGNTLKLEDLLKPDCVPDESAGGENWRILHGDTLKLVKGFQPGIFDAVITDPPYASGGTKQNERNRTTNQKYSSMKAENALPDFDGDNKDQRSWTHWMAEWLYDVDVYKRQPGGVSADLCSCRKRSCHHLPGRGKPCGWRPLVTDRGLRKESGSL